MKHLVVAVGCSQYRVVYFVFAIEALLYNNYCEMGYIAGFAKC